MWAYTALLCALCSLLLPAHISGFKVPRFHGPIGAIPCQNRRCLQFGRRRHRLTQYAFLSQDEPQVRPIGSIGTSEFVENQPNTVATLAKPPRPPRSDFVPKNRERFEHILDESIIRIECTKLKPDFTQPWRKESQQLTMSSGFVIEGNLLVTNAHSVEYGVVIKVKKRGDSRRFMAKVVSIAHDCDLALLSVDDADFWNNTSPVSFGGMPALQDQVLVVGYPTGGSSVAITAGVVSRREISLYQHTYTSLLAIQIDAAINPGNSGGPVLDLDYNVIGIAFQGFVGTDVENIGYVIPLPVLKHFIESVKRFGCWRGVCCLGVTFELSRYPAIKQYFGAPSNMSTGIVIREVLAASPAAKLLNAGDIVTHIDGIQVKDDGTMDYDGLTELDVDYYFKTKFPDQTVEISLLRNGSEHVIKVPLWIPRYRIPRSGFDHTLPMDAQHPIVADVERPNDTLSDDKRAFPGYLVVGGLVFLRALAPLLQPARTSHALHYASARDWSLTLQDLLKANTQTVEDPSEDVVVLGRVFAHETTNGFDQISSRVLSTVNGTPIKSLKHLYDLVQNCTAEPFVIFEFKCGTRVVLETAKIATVTQQLCAQNFISSPVSVDLAL